MVRRAAFGLVLVSLSVLAAPDRAATATGDRGEIEALLERRAEAVLEQDKDAFMATVSRASPAFRERQSLLFDQLLRVPLATYRLRVRWDAYGDLVRPSDRAAYPGAELVSIPLTEERYRIAGFGRTEAVEHLFFTFVKSDGTWLIAEDSDLDDLGFFSARHLWDLGTVYTDRSRHFLMIGERCDTPACDEIRPLVLPLAERALERVNRHWPVDWVRSSVILLPASSEDLTRMLQATFDVSEFVAFAYSNVDLRRGYHFTGPRVIFSPDALAGRAADSVELVLSHELLHVATRPLSGPFVPVFIEEGLADYVAYERAPPAPATSGLDGELPEDFEFLTGSASAIVASYQEARSAVRFLIERWGMRKLVAFYRRLGRARSVAGTSRYHLDRVMKSVIGIRFRRFEELWASSLT